MTNLSADYTIEFATDDDMPQILHLAHDAFSSELYSIDFASLLPKLYGVNKNSAVQHLVLRAKGELRAMLCIQILTIFVGESSCKAGYIGTVSVRAEYRGRGYMQALLCVAQQKLCEAGCALGVLGGQRQRYEYFGFEPAGCIWDLTLTADNVRHACKNTNTILELAPLCQNEEWINAAKAMHDALSVHCMRDINSFCDILSSWHAKPLAVLSKDKFVGYCSISFTDGQATLQEISLVNKDDFQAFCNALFRLLSDNSCKIVLPAIKGDAQSFFASICDKVSLGSNHSYAIYDYCAALQPFLQLRCAAGNVPNENICVKIERNDKSTVILKFSACNGSATVSQVKNGCADITLSQLEAIQLFFAPHSPLVSSDIKMQGSLFPLPLYIAAADGI